jgi:hypothetical protein
MSKKVWKVFETAFSPFLCHKATTIYILCSPSPFISRLILPTHFTTNWNHVKNKNIQMKSQGITTSEILSYLILFYLILSYFILLYLILFHIYNYASITRKENAK